MTFDQVKQYYGNSNQFELKTGMSHTNWINWERVYGYVPIESQMRIEKFTNGELKASLDDVPTRG